MIEAAVPLVALLMIAPPDAPPLPVVEPVRAIGDTGQWVLPGDYPFEALARGEQGTTGFALIVGTDGRVLHCKVTRPSGVALLDEQACVALRVRGRFEPARDRNGQATIGRYRSRVAWQLPKPTPVEAAMRARNRPEPGDLEVVALIDENGRVEQCDVIENSLVPLPPEMLCAEWWESTAIPPFTDENGNPAARRVRVRSSLTIEVVEPQGAAPME